MGGENREEKKQFSPLSQEKCVCALPTKDFTF